MAAAAAVVGSLTDIRKLKLSQLPQDKSSAFSELIEAIESTKQQSTPLKALKNQNKVQPASAGSAAGSAADSSKQFTKLTGVAAKLDIQNIDTDMIIPKQFLKTIKRSGLGVSAFYELRYDSNGAERPNFILNDKNYRSASILVAGDNFGCGSSREHAPWALRDFGIRVIIRYQNS
jgi:3-isopropylmalate dehydratase